MALEPVSDEAGFPLWGRPRVSYWARVPGLKLDAGFSEGSLGFGFDLTVFASGIILLLDFGCPFSVDELSNLCFILIEPVWLLSTRLSEFCLC